MQYFYCIPSDLPLRGSVLNDSDLRARYIVRHASSVATVSGVRHKIVAEDGTGSWKVVVMKGIVFTGCAVITPADLQ